MNQLPNELQQIHAQHQTRRLFLQNLSYGLGGLALGTLFSGCKTTPDNAPLQQAIGSPMIPRLSQFAPKAKRVIYVHMAGSPSQLELFDYKPELQKVSGQACPQSFLEGKKFAFIRGIPNMLGPQTNFAQHGQSGAWVSDLLPQFAQHADDVTFLKAMYTDQFNHAPAQLLLLTGAARQGRPSIGSWVTYGLGSENQNLPGFVVLVSGGNQPDAGKSAWGSGFLPSVYQGVQCRSEGDPVLYISNPEGVTRDVRRKTLDAIDALNKAQYEDYQDPETLARIAQYELAYKMQVSVPEVMDINKEPDSIKQLYGIEPGKASLANNLLLARKLVEKGVRFVQLFDYGWDSHGTNAALGIDAGFREKCGQLDQPISALLTDLKQRGLLDETLVVWGGEFGRTPMQQSVNGRKVPFVGRDHHVEAFTIWMAGGGVKAGMTYGETDAMGYSGVSGRVHVHDLQATILHLMGFDHEKLTFDFQGRPFRLTDTAGKVVKPILV
ncbi:DUF1501 domain-containing protein [Fibrella aquatilis]|uniref:DUF1501 domain-containing protein n=1 Tax=Fibrella aquatilis TaxID=2817059 RepID=A0A939JWK3_9BACT|nr:DUF1501 domain-containing protein [Fibrella aquatilis]MBO0932002.1 DUF1501 domain-containing protein [Fibrella aquatilis]